MVGYLEFGNSRGAPNKSVFFILIDKHIYFLCQFDYSYLILGSDTMLPTAKTYIGAASVALASYAINPALLRLPPEKSASEAWTEWLDQVVEEPIDTHIPIIDPHHHLWDPLYVRILNT